MQTKQESERLHAQQNNIRSGFRAKMETLTSLLTVTNR